MVRKPLEWPGVRAAPGNALMAVDAACGPWARNLSLGYLPLPLFANGHGYFVQADPHPHPHPHPHPNPHTNPNPNPNPDQAGPTDAELLDWLAPHAEVPEPLPSP